MTGASRVASAPGGSPALSCALRFAISNILKMRRTVPAWACLGLSVLALSCFGQGQNPPSNQASKRPERIAEAHAQMVRSVAISPDGKTLASVGDEGTVKLWDMASGGNLATLQGAGPFSITSVAFSPDGKTLAGGGVPNVWLWNVTTRKEKAVLRGHFLRVDSVAFSPDGKALAAGGAGDVTFWELATNQKKTTLGGHSGIKSIAFSPDGKKLAATSLNDVKLWEVAGAKQLSSLKSHSAQVEAVAFSPDGKRLASAGGTLKLWDMATGLEVMSFPNAGRSVAFSPNGNLLAAGGATGPNEVHEGQVLLWKTR